METGLPGILLAPGPGPSPAETDAIAWAQIDESAAKRRLPGARALAAFVRDVAHAHATPQKDDRTNVIDQDARLTYDFGPEPLRELFRHLDACRRERSVTHWSERQGTPAAPRCGIMLDYDLVVADRAPTLTDRHYFRLAHALCATLARDLDFDGASSGAGASGGGGTQSGGTQSGAAGGGGGAARSAETVIHVFFIVKPEATPIAADAAKGEAAGPVQYKFGLHVLVPGVKVGRAYKKWLVRQFAADASVAATMRELGELRDPAACLDQNSAHVPVLFFGSCKRGGTPYVLGAALEATLEAGLPPLVRRLEPKDLEPYNLVAELSLVAEADYGGARPPLVRKREVEPTAEVAARAQDWGGRAADGVVAAEELLVAEHELSTLTLHNAEARYLHALLDLLSEEYYTERGKWRDVIFALANTSSQYKPLAVWFSHKCPPKWADGGLAALDALWDGAVTHSGAAAGAGGRPLTVRSIAFWARSCDPVRYAEAMERSYFTILTNYVYANGGKLGHYMVAKILHAMLSTKYCVDIDSGPRGGASYCWFEFVLPGEPMKPGEVWKWRKEVEPDGVHVYMSEKLTRVLDQVSEHLESRRVAAGNENAALYYKALAAEFKKSKQNLYCHNFKRGVIGEASYIFRCRDFVDRLDRIPFLFGTRNGVLRLGARCEHIAHYHEWPISRFTAVAYARFDPAAPDPWQRLVLDAIANIIVEPDARDWILFHAAQGLSGEPKEGLMLLWEGGGQNGKTSFLRWVAKTLGPYADKFNIQLMCSPREDADRPNSAMMRFKHVNYAYSEESNKAQALNVARMKEMVNPGEVSGRDLHSKQETFTMKANFVAASQYSFIVNTTDHGTWRRLRHYTAKAKFRKDPDPANPLEKKDDQRYVRQYPDDPNFQTAFLGILVHYYERLQREFGGELKNVRCPTIEAETEAFRVSQDALHRWLCAQIVVSPGHLVDYSLGALAGYYTDWYNTHIEKQRQASTEIIKEIESSIVGKYLSPAANRTLVLRGCRVLMANEMELRPGEILLTTAEFRGPARAPAAGASSAAGLSWWVGGGATAGEAPAAEDDLLRFRDDAKLMRAEKAAALSGAPGETPGGVPAFDIDELFDDTPLSVPATVKYVRPTPATLEDFLYGADAPGEASGEASDEASGETHGEAFDEAVSEADDEANEANEAPEGDKDEAPDGGDTSEGADEQEAWL